MPSKFLLVKNKKEGDSKTRVRSGFGLIFLLGSGP
jgi:hypothetical protein